MKKLFLRFLYSVLIKPFLRYIIGVNFDDQSVVYQHSQFIIVANHNSHMDTAVILASLPASLRALTHPTAAADYFSNPIIRFLVSNLFNAVFIRRSSIRALEDMQHYLDMGHSLIIFPEGTRGNPEELNRFKRGVGVLLKNNPHIPYIPYFLSGLGKVLPKNDGLVVPFTSHVFIGDAHFVTTTDIDEIMQDIYNHLMELKNE